MINITQISKSTANLQQKIYQMKCTESFKHYARIQMAVAGGLGLPPGQLADHHTDARYFQTLTLLFQVIFQVDGHAHRRTFAKRKCWRLRIVIIVICDMP